MTFRLPTLTIESPATSPFTAKDTKGTKFTPKGISSSSFQRLWEAGYTGKGIIVAVIDVGIDANHPDLKGKVLKNINLTSEPLNESHGTHVAGTIAGNGWLIGGAYDSQLIDIKVIGKDGGTIDNIVRAISIATSQGATIVNMSIGGSGISQADINRLTVAINNAWNLGTVCVAAAGNEGVTINTPDAYSYPASVERSESIAACDTDEDFKQVTLAYFSNENNRVDLSACGVNVLSSVKGGGYAVYSGTSMATPHVSAFLAGLAQYVKSKYPALKGASFSSALVSLLNTHILKINAGLIVHYKKQNNVKEAYANNSYGLGYLRYEPSKGPVTVPGTKFYSQGVFLGHIST